MLLLGLACVAGPFVLPQVGFDLGFTGSVVAWAFGGALLLISSALIVFTKMYRKTSASEVFVRTGASGGLTVFKDGGAIIVPIIHNVNAVSLRQLRLEITRNGENALLTSDKFRADVTAQFFVRVPAEDKAIQDAARTFGKEMTAQIVREHAENLLDSTLRAVATKKSLEELNSDRDAFIEEVQKAVEGDLRKMGLQLDTVTISNLDQTDSRQLNEQNVFNAQGLRSAAKITQEQLTERNEIVRRGEIARTQQDVGADQEKYKLEQTREEAAADQRAKIAAAQAKSDQEAQEQKVKAEKAVELAKVEKTKATEVAQRQQQQAVEVAERGKEEEVAKAEARRAAAQAELAKAEAEREKEQQTVRTVAAVEAANREKQKQVIEAEAIAEQNLIAQQREADAKAYTVKREAEAGKEAADAKAEAIRKEAEARRDAKVAEADGEKAVQLVPVDVRAREVDVERRNVEEVLKPTLEAREQSGKVAQEFELDQLRITKTAEVQIATAQAAATLIGKVEAKVVGTPEAVQDMVKGIMGGMGLTQALEGALEGVGPKTRDIVETVVQKAESVLSGASDDEPGKEEEAKPAPVAEPAPAPPAPAPTPKSTPRSAQPIARPRRGDDDDRNGGR
jgi:flotillin